MATMNYLYNPKEPFLSIKMRLETLDLRHQYVVD